MSTTSPPSALVGAQLPRVRSVPSYVSSAGDEVVELAASAGLLLDPWQQLVLRDALGEQAGRWAAFEVALVVPRQNGKGSVLEALELGALFLPDPDAPPPLILHSAHEFKTSAEHFRRMRDLIERSPQLSALVRIVRTAAGSESIELHSGARIRFVTRTGGSGRGFSADLIVIDEAYNLTAEAMAAVLPTMSARPNPQVWYTSSAGMESSDQLARLRERGLAGGDRSLAYFEWSAPDGSDLDDPAVWAASNPAMGIRIPVHFVSAERAALPDQQFARERCGVWQAKDDRLPAFDLTAWQALADPNADRGDGPVFAVSCPQDRTWAAVAAAWRRLDNSVHVSLVENRQGTAWVADRVAELRSRWGGRVAASAAAHGLVPGAEEPPVSEQALAHNEFADRVTAGTVRHDDDPAVLESIRRAQWVAMGDTRRLDRRGSSDISPLDAVALAAHLVGDAQPDILQSVW